MFGDRRHPRASRMSYALANKEDAIIQRVEAEIAKGAPAAKINTLMFDGVVICMPKNLEWVSERRARWSWTRCSTSSDS